MCSPGSFRRGPKKLIPVEMNQVVRNLGDPHLGLPGDLVHVLLELPEIRECADIHPGCHAVLERDFQLLDPLLTFGVPTSMRL